MEVKRGRMVHLGYGKYWRSDEIVGLSPIEKDRGPGRRTEVWVATREEPLVASRTLRRLQGRRRNTMDTMFNIIQSIIF